MQLRSDSLSRVALDSDRAGEPGVAAAPICRRRPFATAVGQEIEDYPGVSQVRTGLTGRPDQPRLRLRVTIEPDADLGKVRRQITDDASTNARIALDAQHLPTQLRLDRRAPGEAPPQRDLTRHRLSPTPADKPRWDQPVPPVTCTTHTKEEPMSLGDKIKNAAEEAVGKVKETTGKVTGNEELEARGQAEQAGANVKQTGEKAKDTVKDVFGQ